MYNATGKGKASTMPGGLLAGVLSSLAMILLGSAITAKTVETELLEQSHIGYCIMALLILASWTGSAVSAAKIKRQKIAVCALSGCLLWMTLLCITALFFGGQFRAVGETGLLILCGSGLGILTQAAPKKHRKNRKRILRNC